MSKSNLVLASEMMDFLNQSPLSGDLVQTRDQQLLEHFEAPRLTLMCEAIAKGGYKADQAFKILDFGYLNGLSQEFVHRAFPKAQFTVFDIPSSPNFKDAVFMDAIRARWYLDVRLGDISSFETTETFDVVILGEIIEHLDPTIVGALFNRLKSVMKPGALMVITTPNGAGLVNCFALMRDGEMIILHPPIPDELMGCLHIHLWPMIQLKPTAEHFGWQFKSVDYYHGRDGELFERSRKKWASLKHQITIKILEFITNRKPKLRGYYVAAFELK